MAKYQITAPDGSRFEVTAPDGAPESDVMAYAQAQFSAQKPVIEKPLAVRAGEALAGIPRQVGLTARHGIEGLAQTAEIVTEPLRMLVTDPLMRAVTGGNVDSPRASEMAARAADAIGLPKPRDANERVVGDISRLMAGASGLNAIGRAAAGLPGMAGKVGEMFAANPLTQVAAAGGAGGAGGAVREAGGGPGAQFAASLIGGVAAPLSLNASIAAGTRGANAIRRAMTPQKVIDAQVDQQIELALKRSGIDWAGVSERIKQSMRADVADALSTGDALDPAATARLLQFKIVPGSQPTRGMLSQDPVQITKERNLAKVGANSADIGLQKLPQLQSDNTRALLNTLDDAGARGAPDAFAAGERGVNALKALAARETDNIDRLYSAARDTQGRSVQLDGGSAMRNANERMQRDLVGKLPPEVDGIMNGIATGKTPLTVDYQQQLLKTLYRKMQAAGDNGDLRHGLRILREALDDAAPIEARSAGPVNPGNLPATRGGVVPSGGAANAGDESIAAFRAARSANREWQQRVESTPALKAVVDGIEPDLFVKKFITGQGAAVGDVRALRDAAAGSPEALQAIKQHLAAHLRRAATGQGDDINNFRASTFGEALDAIGDRKLAVFFAPDEIATLRAVGKTANYMTAQPAGTAVNNSNSGALVAAKAVELLDSIGGKVPLVGDAIRGTIRGVQQRQVLQSGNALRQLAQPAQRVNPLLALPVVATDQHRANDR